MNLGRNNVSSSNDLFLQVTQNLLGILVRDESARDELREQVGEIGLIMFVKYPSAEERRLTRHNRTLYESKGLEFDDVRSNKIVSRKGVQFLTSFCKGPPLQVLRRLFCRFVTVASRFKST